MTAVSSSFAILHTTDAEFRVWAKGISDGLIAVGMVRTADTGQIDFTTAVRPAANAFLYEIFRFSDALQATSPVFIKMEYGTSSTLTIPATRISVANGTSGAGVLTGRISSLNTSATSTATAGAKTSFFSGDGGYLNMLVGTEFITTLGSVFTAFSLERTLNDDGAANAAGVLLTYFDGGTTGYQQTLALLTATAIPPRFSPPAAVYPHYAGINAYTSGSVAADVSFFPTMPALPSLNAPAKAILGMITTDLARFTTVLVPTYGVNRTYLVCGPEVKNMGIGAGSAGVGVLANAGIAIRYE